MITWMQRHKKWLVITIWVSTIAFVGAGFVGWGSYDYGSKSGAVAVVGDRKIFVEEYQREYSSLYDQYAKMFGAQFNKELADKLNLKKAAYDLAIQKNLILSYGDELGLDVTDEEIAKQLVKYEAFKKDGKFDKDTYIKVLRQNRTTPKEFEASLRRDLLLQKIESIFKIEVSKNELKNLNKLLFSEDELSIKILDANSFSVDIKDKDLKNYWETNKDNYKSKPSIQLDIDELAISNNTYTQEEIAEYYKNFRTDFKKDDGKIKSLDEAKEDIIRVLNAKDSKKMALKKYLKLKKGEEKFSSSKKYLEENLPYSVENNKEILSQVPGDVLKPFLEGDKYIIVKILNKTLPKTLSFEDAKAMVLKDYEKVAKSLKVEQEATNMLKDFKGQDIGYVSRNSFNKIPGLNKDEALSFLNKLFAKTEKKVK